MNIYRRLEKLEAAYPAGNGLEAARAFARAALEIKTGLSISDSPLLDRLATWGADHAVSVKCHLDAMARIDRLASYLGAQADTVPGTGQCTDLAGKTAEGILAMLEAEQVDELDLMTLFGIKPQEDEMNIKRRLEILEARDGTATMDACLTFVDQLRRDLPDLTPESEESRQSFARTVYQYGGPKHFIDGILKDIDGLTATLGNGGAHEKQ